VFEDVPVKITSISVILTFMYLKKAYPSDCKYEADNGQRSAAKSF